MSSLKAVPYRQLIDVLVMLDVYIPFMPWEPDRTFVIYRGKGTGYVPVPTPPCYPFMSKDAQALVPRFEIDRLLKGLEITKDEFLTMLKLCPIVAPVAETSEPKATDGGKQ